MKCLGTPLQATSAVPQMLVEPPHRRGARDGSVVGNLRVGAFLSMHFHSQKTFFSDFWLDTSVTSKSTSQPHCFTTMRGACQWRPASQRCPRTVCLTLTLRFGEGKVGQWFGSDFWVRFIENLEENMKNH